MMAESSPPTVTTAGTVLVVDDEDGVRASVRAILDDTPCRVLEARDGGFRPEPFGPKSTPPRARDS